MSTTDATSEQVEEAVRINTQGRLRALKLSFLILASIAALAIFPSAGLPNYNPGDVATSPRRADSNPAGNNQRDPSNLACESLSAVGSRRS